MKLRYLAAAGAAVLGVAAMTLPTVASAEIVCNGENECWHVRDHYDYKPEWGLTVHEDSWKWGADDHYKWHEHHGRGYWHNGAWVVF